MLKPTQSHILISLEQNAYERRKGKKGKRRVLKKKTSVGALFYFNGAVETGPVDIELPSHARTKRCMYALACRPCN